MLTSRSPYSFGHCSASGDGTVPLLDRIQKMPQDSCPLLFDQTLIEVLLGRDFIARIKVNNQLTLK